ncbi:FHA domain-containing protein [Streptomyces pharetrae]|uniref:FHA domain-containing protein n=1 Tax=Streptomyces pharetrae TaxID=291370 RepID=UPI0033451070
MQIRLTVVDPLGPPAVEARGRAASRDVLVTAPAGTALSAVASALASAVTGDAAPAGPVVLYAGAERLDERRCTLGEPPLLDGAVLSLGAPADPEPHPEVDDAPARLDVVAGPDAGGVHLLHGGRIDIGRSGDADVPLDDPDVSRLHCAVTLDPDGRVTVADLGSTNGTTLDGARVGSRPVRLPPGALLRLGESALRLAPAGGPGARRGTAPDGEGYVRVAPASPSAGLPDAPERHTHANGPAGTTRRPGGEGPSADRDHAPVEPPVRPPVVPGQAGAPSLEQGGGPVREGPSRTAPPGARPMPLAQPPADGGTHAGRRGLAGLDGAPAAQPGRRRGGLGAWARRLAGGRGEQPAAAGPETYDGEAGAVPLPAPSAGPPVPETWPDPASVLLTALGPGPRLWERGPGHPEALTVRLGTADRPAPDGSGLLPAVPVTADLREVGALGLAGPRPRLAGLARAVLAQLAALHSPATLEVVLISTDRSRSVAERTAEWAWLGWLPQVRPGHGQDCRLLLAYDREQAAARTDELLRRLDDHLTDRANTAGPTSPGGSSEAPQGGTAQGPAPHGRPTVAGLGTAPHVSPGRPVGDALRSASAEGGPPAGAGHPPATGEAAPVTVAPVPPTRTDPRTTGPGAATETPRGEARLRSHPHSPPHPAAQGTPGATVTAHGTAYGLSAPAAAAAAPGHPGAPAPSRASRDGGAEGRFPGPYTVVVVDGDPGGAGLRDAVARLAVEGPRAGIHVVVLAETAPASPVSPVTETYEAACAAAPAFRACGAVALLSGDIATALRLLRVAPAEGTVAPGPVGHGTMATVDAVSPAWAERFARALAPLRPDGSGGERQARVSAPLPQSARLLDELGLARATPASLMARWADAADDTQALGGRAWAVLGAGPRGPVCTDLVADGPHLLIEGPAGSGRTELLRAVVASLAAAERPDRLGIVLVDGRDSVGTGPAHGDGLRVCTDVPHVTTHLTANDPVRMREFAQSLSAELKRRAELLGRSDFAEWHTGRELAGRMVAQRSAPGRQPGQVPGRTPGPGGGSGAADLDGPPSSTLRLRPGGARRQAEAAPPLPRLVVVVDDLDALVSPALGSPGRPAAGSVVRALEAVARDGERLGVHLVAAAGPGGRTAESEAARRARLRIALDAPAPGPDEPSPGRGRLTGPDGRVTPFQGGRVTGRIPRTATLRPTVVPLDWQRMGDPPARRPVRELGNGPTDLALLASALERAAREVSAAQVPSLL